MAASNDSCKINDNDIVIQQQVCLHYDISCLFTSIISCFFTFFQQQQAREATPSVASTVMEDGSPQPVC